MVSMTYGTLPTFEEFQKAFERECPIDNYKIRNDKRVGNANFNVFELWQEVLNAINEGFDKDLEDPTTWMFANDVLYTLGFEWI